MTTDLRTQVPGYTAPRGRFELLTVPPLQFLVVDGHGDPGTSPAWSEALATLYPVAYRVRFAARSEPGRDYRVMPLEALWWSDDMSAFTTARDKARWSWTVMTAVPGWIGDAEVEAARGAVAAKGGAPRLDALRLETVDEGLVVQTLHVGPYDDEGPVLEEMHRRYIPAQGLQMTGRHHEVYLNDARRTAPQRLRTILRQPVAHAAG